MQLRLHQFVLIVLLVCGRLEAELPKPAAAPPRFYEEQVRPILEAHCHKCHAGAKVRGGLRLTSKESILQGGDLGPAVDLEKPEESTLLGAINYRDLEMPPTGKLEQAKIDVLTTWVRLGLPGIPEKDTKPATGEPKPTAGTGDKEFWSFQPVCRPGIPRERDRTWARNPIDAFILARLEQAGLEPNPPADRGALARRMYFDFTGLPPTPDQVEAFTNDLAPDAASRLAERLLATPMFGEKWSRHWLDVVRFAETNSFERDRAKPYAWRYRDYVIRSFNEDKPYDQFLREQLAGDELEQVTPETIIATGFYRLGAWDDEPTDPLQAWYDELDDIVATTGQTFLGLTLNCARCHDHKLDPIPQRDYYSLLAFFHNVRRYGYGDPKKPELSPVLLPIGSAPDAWALAIREAGPSAPPTHVLIRGNAHAKGDPVDPAFPAILDPPTPVIQTPKDGRSSGRRLALANWLCDPKNPLTARVIVNRIWQHHFGRGIVRSPNNFGKIGDAPTHPQLLDWLAAELIDSGWRLKHIHRLIATSNTYQMSSIGSAAALSQDPENQLFWRFDMRRLGAEEIRDSVLAVNGTLSHKMYGPGVYTDIPLAVLQGQSRPGDGWENSSEADKARRSVYIHVKRSLITPILSSFDFADTDSSCPVRFATTQSTQALGMLNSRSMNGEADLFAQRLKREAASDLNQRVRLALRLALSRQPAPTEIQRGLELIDSFQKKDGLSEDAALRHFCLMVLNLNEFMYLD